MSGLTPQEEILQLAEAIQDIQWTRFALCESTNLLYPPSSFSYRIPLSITVASATIIFYDYGTINQTP